jgi:hypothetical protein
VEGGLLPLEVELGVGMAIEVGSASVIDRLGPGVLVSGGDLDLSELITGVERIHNESRLETVL